MIRDVVTSEQPRRRRRRRERSRGLRYEPSRLIAKIGLREKAANLVSANLSVNRAAMRALADFGVLPKRALESVALKVIKSMRERAAEERAAGATKAEANEAARNDARLMQSRVQAAALSEQTRAIKRVYRGTRYEWLKSTAKVPREEHIENYGRIFVLGKGDKNGNDPGDLPGCQCGMRILTDDTPGDFNRKLEESF